MSDSLEAPGRGDDVPVPRSQQEKFLIVGIGASAGGIDALKAFFARVPGQSGAAYVVILHLSPDHESQLAQILQAVSAIPVTQVRERIRVMPDCAYVIPPSQSLAMEDGHLAVSPIRNQEQRRAPIDLFFRTLADSQHSRAVCVVLSGTGADGSSGLKWVKEAGGVCIAQDPTEAQHGDMPRHAIDTQLVDDVLPVREIPAKIITYGHYRDLVRGQGEATEVDERALRDILAQLRTRTGHDFASYKRSTVLRRLERRLTVHGLTGLEAYAAWLREHPDDARALLKDLLISVTEFFRDPQAFAALERDVIPRLFEHKGVNDYIRVWVTGCATGEEVYSVAMLLCECVADPLNGPTIQVFATDIDEWALAKARAGFYTVADLANVSPERLRRFFVQESDGYRVRTELREMVLFATHNVIRHPPYSHLDLITCRNLLIYINRPAQQRVIEVFHFGLKPGGFLFLGTSESLDGTADLFAPVDKEARIFRSRTIERRTTLAFSSLNVTPPGLPPLPEEEPARRSTQERVSRQALHQRLLEHYAPPSVVVDAEHEIAHLSDNAGRYMTMGGGEPSRNLLVLVRPELRMELRMALYQAAQGARQVKTRPIEISVDGVREHLRVIVRPVADEEAGFILVLFDNTEGDAAPDAGVATVESEGSTGLLEGEVTRLRAQLSATIAQHGVQEEELKATNEELQSINEELRSASEELEIGKEELQSYNEELSTVNQELKVKIDELTQANNDTRNFMNSADTAMLFLDRGLRLRRFTPRARAVFNLIPEDVGRPLLHITQKVRYDELEADIDRVAETLQTLEREIVSDSGQCFLAKVLPYRTNDDRIDGTVLTFTDISSRKAAEEAIRASEERFRRIVEEAPIPVVMQAEDGQVLQVSRSWTELTGYTLQDIPTFGAWVNHAYGEGADAVRDHMRDLFDGARRVLDVEFKIRTRSNTERHWSFSASTPSMLADGRRFIVGMAVDVTDRSLATEAVRRSDERLHLTLESVTDYAILTMDPAGLIETWNIGADRIFGYAENEAVGQSAAIIFTPEDRQRGAPEEEMRTAREEGSAADERWHIRKNGERFFASGVLSRITDEGRLIGYCKVARDLTAKQEAEEALREARDLLERRVMERTRDLAQANEALRLEVEERKESEELRVRLLSQLVDAQENERRRVSRELHDQLGQQVTALSLNIPNLRGLGADHAAMQAEIDKVEAIVKQLDADVDFLVWQLRPTTLDDLGLVDALSDYVAMWSGHVRVRAHVDTSRMHTARLPGDIETVLYRIAQEALNNVAKHAAAKNVDVLLERRADHVSLIIEDDGVGFDTDKAAAHLSGLGLVGMRERAAFAGGTVTIESAPDRGTTVIVRIPVIPSSPGAAPSS